MNSKVKEPLFHIVKRDALPWQRGLRIRLLAILAALVVCGILTTVLTGINPVPGVCDHFYGSLRNGQKELDHVPECGDSASDLSGIDIRLSGCVSGISAVKDRY